MPFTMSNLGLQKIGNITVISLKILGWLSRASGL